MRAKFVEFPRTRRLCLQQLEPRLCLTVPGFSSLPGADHTIYLDFDGEIIEGSIWNSYYNQSSLNAQPFDTDGNSSNFSPTELARIEEAWKRTAEDFRPFNVNVTTVDPGAEALMKSDPGDSSWGVRVVVTNESNMISNSANYCGCGGIAYIDSFNWSSDTPVWVYTTGGKSIAEAASHEIGHSLGLSHDGLLSGTTYYAGHGDGETGWSSIMGVGYYENVTQWDKGEYYNSNNGGGGANYGDGPDDLAIIVGQAGQGNGFGYRTDDHGNSAFASSQLGLFGGSTISDVGVIETTSDVDVFRFTTGTGIVSINIAPFTPGPNLDVRAVLYDGEGNVAAISDSSSALDASFNAELLAGEYFLHVEGTGWGTPSSSPPSGFTEYASLGQYSISGSIIDPGSLPSVSIDDVSIGEADGSVEFILTLSEPAATVTSVNWGTSNLLATSGSDYVADSGLATFAAGVTTATVNIRILDDVFFEGDETFALNLTHPIGLILGDTEGVATIIENDSAPLPTVSILDANVQEGKLNTRGKNAGTPQLTDLVFNVSLSSVSNRPVSVTFQTADGTATTANNDFQHAAGTLTFAPGETAKTITVTVVGDNVQEPDETLTLDLYDVTNATLADSDATGTILDDDSGGGGRGGGNGNGGGKGKGKSSRSESPYKRLSELFPVAIVDELWIFDGPSSFEHDHDHNQGNEELLALPITAILADLHSTNRREEVIDIVVTELFFERSDSSPNKLAQGATGVEAAVETYPAAFADQSAADANESKDYPELSLELMHKLEEWTP